MYSSKILDTSNTDWMAEAKGGGRGVYVMNISQGQTKEQFEHFWANTGVPCCEFH